MRYAVLLFAVLLSGCASLPMNCEEACSFEHMVCKGAEISEESSAASALFGNGGPVTQHGRSLKYVCELDTSKLEDVKKVRERYIEKDRARFDDDIGVLNRKKSKQENPMN